MAGSTRAKSMSSVQAKRANTTQGAIRRKAARGEATGDERALVRVGTRATKVLTGQDDLSTWTDEDLRRGQKADKNGQVRGRPPVVVPKAIHDELVRRTLNKAAETMRDNLELAVEMLVEVVKGKDVEDKDRLRAIGMIMDRVMGKTPEKVELTGEMKPWEVAVRGGLVRIKPQAEEQDDEDIVDAEVLEDSDE